MEAWAEACWMTPKLLMSLLVASIVLTRLAGLNRKYSKYFPNISHFSHLSWTVVKTGGVTMTGLLGLSLPPTALTLTTAACSSACDCPLAGRAEKRRSKVYVGDGL